MVTHHHRRRLVEALDQKSRLVPDRQADRAHRAGHALSPQPILGSGDEQRRRLAVERFEHAPLAKARAHMLQHQIVDLSTDPSDWPPVPLCKPQCRAGMAEPRVFSRIEEGVNLAFQRRDPSRILAINVPHKVDERSAVTLGDDWPDDGQAHGRARCRPRQASQP